MVVTDNKKVFADPLVLLKWISVRKVLHLFQYHLVKRRN